MNSVFIWDEFVCLFVFQKGCWEFAFEPLIYSREFHNLVWFPSHLIQVALRAFATDVSRPPTTIILSTSTYIRLHTRFATERADMRFLDLQRLLRIRIWTTKQSRVPQYCLFWLLLWQVALRAVAIVVSRPPTAIILSTSTDLPQRTLVVSGRVASRRYAAGEIVRWCPWFWKFLAIERRFP